MLYRVWADSDEYQIVEAANPEDAKRIFREKIGRKAMVVISVDQDNDAKT